VAKAVANVDVTVDLGKTDFQVPADVPATEGNANVMKVDQNQSKMVPNLSPFLPTDQDVRDEGDKLGVFIIF